MATDSRLLEMTPSSRLRVSVLLLNGDLLVLSLAPSNFESRGVASLSRRSSIFLPHLSLTREDEVLHIPLAA